MTMRLLAGALMALGLIASGWMGLPACMTDHIVHLARPDVSDGVLDGLCYDSCAPSDGAGAANGACPFCSPALTCIVDGFRPEADGWVTSLASVSRPLDAPVGLLRPPLA